jgi:hypothetical protein
MNYTIKQLNKAELEEMLNEIKPTNVLSEGVREALEEQGWEIKDAEYCMEKVYEGYHLVIEFCMGDFCTSICSKNGHWLLESKTPKDTFIEAIIQQKINEGRIDSGEHWTGEDN